MEIFIASIILGLILAKKGQKPAKKRGRGRRLSDEVHPIETILMSLLF
jgi:hypothetical protein